MGEVIAEEVTTEQDVLINRARKSDALSVTWVPMMFIPPWSCTILSEMGTAEPQVPPIERVRRKVSARDMSIWLNWSYRTRRTPPESYAKSNDGERRSTHSGISKNVLPEDAVAVEVIWANPTLAPQFTSNWGAPL